MAFALLEVPDFFLHRAGRDEFVGVDSFSLSDAVRAVNGLGFHGGVPPWIVQYHITRGGEIEAGAGGAEAKQENARAFGFLERVDDILPVFGFTGEHVRGDLARAAIFFQNFQHLHKLAEDQNFFALGDQGFEKVE